MPIETAGISCQTVSASPLRTRKYKKTEIQCELDLC